MERSMIIAFKPSTYQKKKKAFKPLPTKPALN